MVKTLNDIINSRSFERIGSMAVIQRKNFLNKEIRSHNLMGLTFAHLTFVDCNFIDINFRQTTFIYCDFMNCSFTETLFYKAELENCSFKNSKIAKSDFSIANCTEGYFLDCQFDDVDLSGAVFTECEFIKSKFNKMCSVEFLTLTNSKIWNSTEWIEVHTFDDVSQILNELED